jgi:hypothetical protein
MLFVRRVKGLCPLRLRENPTVCVLGIVIGFGVLDSAGDKSVPARFDLPSVAASGDDRIEVGHPPLANPVSRPARFGVPSPDDDLSLFRFAESVDLADVSIR